MKTPVVETPRLHRCLCVNALSNWDRCSQMVSLDQPICDDCEEFHQPLSHFHILPIGASDDTDTD